MFDEGWVYARLDSPLFGALTHVVESMSPPLRADVAAGRVFGVAAEAPLAYVNAGRLGLSALGPDLQAWPLREHSAFEYAYRLPVRDGAFWPTQWTDREKKAFFDDQRFHPLTQSYRVVDVLGVACPLDRSATCILLFLRCDQSGPFEGHHLHTAQRLHPALSRNLRQGYRQQVPARAAKPPTARLNAVPLTRLLAKLSPMERTILNHLRSDLTEREVAHRLRRSPHTIHVHVKNIYRKLDVTSRKQLMNRLRQP